MLRDALFLARMDLRFMFRARETWFWVFLMPVVFFYFIGTITGGFGGAAPDKDPIAVQVPTDAGFLADILLHRIQARNFRLVRVTSDAEFARFRRRLALPAGFTEAILARQPVKITLSRTGGGMGADYDQVRLSRAVYSVLADFVVLTKDGGAPSPAAFDKLAQEPRSLTLEVRSAGKRQDPPTGFEQSVPGTLVMFTLLVMFTSGGISLTVERNQGILRRLASSPMTRGSVVLGKWGARMALGVIQIAFGMATGSVLFHMRWGSNLPVIALVMLAYGAMGAALGMLLSNATRTEGQVAAVGVIGTNVLAALGGCWWPIEVTPRWAQTLALFLPTGWVMDALHKLVSFHAAPETVVPHLIAIVTTALVAGYALSRTFRFE